MGGWQRFTCLWPGLPLLWLKGAFWGLAIALLFSLLFNLTLVVTFVWFETISAFARNLLWLTIGVSWTASAAISWWWLARQQSPQTTAESDDWFRMAQQQYLSGNWIDAELRLLKILGRNAGDADARLLLSSLYRHTRRFAEAEAELHHLERLESAVKWRWEILQEQRLVAGAIGQQTAADPLAAAPAVESHSPASEPQNVDQLEFQPQSQSKAA